MATSGVQPSLAPAPGRSHAYVNRLHGIALPSIHAHGGVRHYAATQSAVEARARTTGEPGAAQNVDVRLDHAGSRRVRFRDPNQHRGQEVVVRGAVVNGVVKIGTAFMP
jgi:hypothetical protein